MLKSRRGVVIALYIASALPILGVLGSGLWLYVDLYSTSDRFHSEIENGGIDEIPLQPEDFMRLNEPPSSEDAADQYIQIAKSWEEFSVEQRNLTLSNLRLYSLPQDITTGDYSNDYDVCSKFIRRLTAVANLSDSRFERTWNGEEKLLEPYYHSTIQFGRMLSSFALCEAKAGRFSSAFSHLNSIRKLAKHISRDSGLDGLVTHINLETQALNTLQEVVFLYGDESGVVNLAVEFLDNRKSKPDLQRNLEGEAMRTIYVLSQPDSFKDRLFSGTKLTLKNVTFQRAAAIRMSEFWVETIENIRPQANDSIASSEIFQNQLEHFESQRSPSRIIPMAIARWNLLRVQNAASLEARYELTKTSVQLLAEYHKSNDFPQSLSSINSRTSDPFNGESFSYSKFEDGFLLYSVGSNRRDDGGNADDPHPQDVILEFKAGSFSIKGI